VFARIILAKGSTKTDTGIATLMPSQTALKRKKIRQKYNEKRNCDPWPHLWMWLCSSSATYNCNL